MMHGASRDREVAAKESYLPFGPAIVLTVASSWAVHRNIGTVIWGATLDDGSARGDYSQKFSSDLSEVLNSTNSSRIKIIAPLANKHKFEVLKAFSDKPELFSKTWSCGEPNATIQCGKDHACAARRIAARIAGISDATSYRSEAYVNPLSPQELKDLKKVSPRKWAKILDCMKEWDV